MLPITQRFFFPGFEIVSRADDAGGFKSASCFDSAVRYVRQERG